MAMNMDAVLRIAAKVMGLADLKRLERGIAGAEKVAKTARSSFAGVVNSASWQAAAAGAAGLGVALGTSVRAAVGFESAMADVRKVVPGLESSEGLRAMKDEILNLSRELPVSAEGLSAIMAAAGQAGIPREQLAQFTRQAAQMGVAFDITADQAGEAMAKLRTSLGLNQEEVVNLADAMNYLSNNMASSAAEVNQFMLAAGAVGKQVAMTTEQTAALGSAMIAAGAAPEVAATSFRNLIRAMAKGESATARQASAFKALGLDANQVAKDMQVNAVGAIRDVFERISRMPAEMRVSTISEIFGDEARALKPLITNMNLFDQALGLVSDKSKYAGSMLAEFQSRAGTSANNFQLLQNNMQALQIAIGEGLLPAINLVLSALTPVLSVLASVAGRFPILTAAVVALAAALAALIIAAPAIVSFITLLGSLKAALGISLLAAGWAGIQTVVIVAVAGMKTALAGLVAWIGSGFVPAILAFFSGPVGWTVLAVAAVVAMAIAFREPIMKFLSWLPGAFKSGFDAAWASVKAGFAAVSNAFNAYVVSPIRQAWTGVVEFLPKGMASVANTVRTIWTNILDGIRNAFTGFLRGIANNINALTGRVNGLISGFNRLGGPQIPRIPQFATGGYVTKPTLAMIGEGGEDEYVVPQSKAASFANNIVAGRTGKQALQSAPTPIATAWSNAMMQARAASLNQVMAKEFTRLTRRWAPDFTGAIIEQMQQRQQRKMMAAPTRTGSAASTRADTAASAPIVIEPKLTGPIMEFNGQKFVSYDDLERAMKATAEGVIAHLRKPQSRIALGRS